MAQDRPADQHRFDRSGQGHRWAHAPRWLVVAGFALAGGLLGWTGIVVYARFFGAAVVGPDVLGWSVGWVLWLTVGFVLYDRRHRPRAWLGYVGGLCLAVVAGTATWWLLSVREVSVVAPLWSAIITGILGTALIFTLPMSAGTTGRRSRISPAGGGGTRLVR